MADWRKNAHEQLHVLLRIAASRPKKSDFPLYVLENITTVIPTLMGSEVDPDTIRAMIRGAFRAAGDVGQSEDDDPVIQALLKLDATLPAE